MASLLIEMLGRCSASQRLGGSPAALTAMLDFYFQSAVSRYGGSDGFSQRRNPPTFALRDPSTSVVAAGDHQEFRDSGFDAPR